jgi:hypothetical protein
MLGGGNLFIAIFAGVSGVLCHVINTLAVTDLRPPEGDLTDQIDGPTRTTGKAEDARPTVGRLVTGGLLLLGAVGVLAWIFLFRPNTLVGTVLLVALCAVLMGGFNAVVWNVLPQRVRGPLLAIVGVAVVSATLIATFLTIPSRDSAEGASASSAEPSGRASQEPADPMTATLDFNDPFLEFFTIPRSLVRSLPRGDDVKAEWIYQHGGASVGTPVLTLQGKTESAVIIERLRVIGIERSTPPSEAVVIFPDGGGGGVMAVRHFELQMSDPPRVISRRGDVDPNGDREPAIKLPVKVTASDPEVFVLDITGPPCFCSFSLAVDWKSGEQHGTMIIDRGFGKIRADTADPNEYDHTYSFSDGKWHNWS